MEPEIALFSRADAPRERRESAYRVWMALCRFACPVSKRHQFQFVPRAEAVRQMLSLRGISRYIASRSGGNQGEWDHPAHRVTPIRLHIFFQSESAASSFNKKLTSPGVAFATESLVVATV